MTLTVQTARRVKDFAYLATEWDALAARQAVRTPFQSSAWHKLWWKHFRRTGSQIRDDLRLYTMRDTAGDLVAIAPMMLTHRPANLPIRTRELQFLGADSNLTEIRGMLCLPTQEAAALHALTRHFSSRTGWDWIQWRGLPGTEPPPIAGFRPSAPLVNFYLPLPDDWEVLRAGLPRNMKDALRKCYNSLARDKHDYAVEIIAEPDAIRSALERLLDMHAMRAEADAAVHHPNVFAAPHARAFITDYVRDAARGGGVRIFALKIAGVPVAMRLGFVYGRELYLYYSGYDPAWGRYSVMTTVVAEAIKWAISQGYERVNLSTGLDVSKTRWRPTQIDFVEGIQPSPTWRGQMALAAMDLVRSRIGPVAGLRDRRAISVAPTRPSELAPMQRRI
jgi:CelD/BcsL family acetyltransferase involved in cellulose biosynthesis